MKYISTLLALCFSVTMLAQTKNSPFDKGSKLLDKKDFVGAKEAFSVAIAQDSTLDAAYYNRALAEFNLKEMDAALSDFKKYNSMDPEDEATMDYISFIHYFKDDYAALKASVQQFMKISSTEYNSNYFLGYACYNLNQYTEALDYLNYHLALDPKHQDALYYRSQTYIALEKPEEAEADLTKLIILKDDYSNAHYFRASIRKEKEKYLAALEDINKTLQQVPEDTDALQLRGEIEILLGDSLAAKTDFDRALELKGSNYYDVLCRRGLLYYMQLGDADAAMADLTAVINDAPEPNVISFFMRGILYTQANKFEEAHADFLRYSTLDTTSVEVYYYWADLKFKMEQYDDALRFINFYLKQDDAISETNQAFAYQLIGKVHLQQKDYAAALQNFEKSLGYDESIGETHFWLAKTLIALKRKEEACKSFHKALEFEYTDAELELQEYCGYSIPLEEDTETGVSLPQ